ncbi:MAG: hypothetical protein FJX36_11180 [Alphaproteobacteria bacterium]|nr:hypothetical protein [Alphaproteobacteria bacterium]
MNAPKEIAFPERFIFTVASGRCGQASFTEWINCHVPDAHAAFEEPHARVRLPGFLGDVERRVRRQFVETDELLGRGRVLAAYARGDDGYLARVAAKRVAMAGRWCAAANKSIYVDVSKYYARGLHAGFSRVVPRFGLAILLRDPVANMRSFLNRGKDFFKDNARPDAPRNCLRMTDPDLAKGELYLWAWCEMYLRYLQLRHSGQVTHVAEIPTRDLDNAGRMAEHFRALDLPHRPLVRVPVRNTNLEAGRGATAVSAEDLRLFERFMNRLPASALDSLSVLRTYAPQVAA